jgi:hypothetical protein
MADAAASKAAEATHVGSTPTFPRLKTGLDSARLCQRITSRLFVQTHSAEESRLVKAEGENLRSSAADQSHCAIAIAFIDSYVAIDRVGFPPRG